MTNADRNKAHRLTCDQSGCWCKRSGKSGKSGKSNSRTPYKPINRPFIAIDGEALGESGYHLLAASTGDEIVSRETSGLSSEQCLTFLLELKKKHGIAIYCGFSLGYDCEHWIRDFGPSLWKAIKETGEGTIKMNGRNYVIQYIPRKWFKIGFYKGSRFLPFIEVYDVFTFFQASFTSVVGGPETGQKKGWGTATAEEMAILTEWKEKRGEFRDEDWEAIRAYNQVECNVLVRLMGQLREALQGAGISLRSWHGPGAVAAFLLKKHRMQEHIAEPPEDVSDAIARAYFGGRFECQQIGHFTGVYDYDISSAYPYATTLLPSTRGKWRHVDSYKDKHSFPWAVYLVSWKDIGMEAGSLKPFPWRDEHGNIHYPSSGRGWYWGFEVAAALSNPEWKDRIAIEEGWCLDTEEEGVFGWLREMAQARVEAKQKAKEANGEERKRWQGIERGYKLALNSIYGKTIQTVGKHRPFLCPMWAGLITSHTRARLMEAALQAPSQSLICFATDGLFSSVPIATIGCGTNLGDWELAEEGITLELYQSGCYNIITKDGEQKDCRFRGVSRKDIDWERLRREWKRKGLSGKVTVKTRRFIGHRTALQRGKPELQCTWVDLEKDLELRPGTGWSGMGGMPANKHATCWDAQFPGTDYSEVSARYRKLPYGTMEEETDEESVQP